MRDRPPLTAARLAQIWDEFPHPIVLELLWEIHRLRSTISRANLWRTGQDRRGAVGRPTEVGDAIPTRDGRSLVQIGESLPIV